VVEAIVMMWMIICLWAFTSHDNYCMTALPYCGSVILITISFHLLLLPAPYHHHLKQEAIWGMNVLSPRVIWKVQ
jgi:hypothetical protein